VIFNSVVFVVFALIFFAIWPFAAPRKHLRWAFICLMSFIFYGWWDWRFLPLMIFSALVDYWAALLIVQHPSRKKPLLVASLAVNLGILGLFKYMGFFTRTANQAMGLLGVDLGLPVIELVLPLGISFYTFQSMSYTIDVYRGQLTPTKDPLHFLAFVTLFPQLVAGPIVRAKDLLPALEEYTRPSSQMVWDGLKLIASGYFKKMVIADNLARAVDFAYGGNIAETSFCYWWIVATMFMVQLYCDFSGYSDIARGLGKWIGYEFMLNFNHPFMYLGSVREFWMRWHISLSTWFRDYVFAPLGGLRRHATRNTFITFVLTGLWHGAGWNFVLFGLFFAISLSLERLTRWPQRLSVLPGGKFAVWFFSITQVFFGAAIFRAQSVEQIWLVAKSLLVPTNLDTDTIALLGALPLGVLAAASVIEIFNCYVRPKIKESPRYANFEPSFQPVVVALLLVAAIFLRGPGRQFVYFQF
jgi:alginate O-acetyltransferase complex protein AlgI